MQYTNDTLEKMHDKKQINYVRAAYFEKIQNEYIEVKDLGTANRFKKKAERMNSCFNYWVWDVYHDNKVMDLQRVIRCKDNKFCPNCRRYNLASCIHNLKIPISDLLSSGYYPYLVTLTVPNVDGSSLRSTIKKMNVSFRKFFQKLSLPIGKGQHGFKHRLSDFDACFKVLEVTYNKKNNTYHPHFHCIFFSKEYNPILYKKYIPGPFSNKKSKYIMYSDMDIFLMKSWKICYDGMVFRDNLFLNLSSNWYDLYQCDIREMDEGGIYEVLKYTFKDSDVCNYDVFRTLFFSLDGMRIRQGHGLLYNVKCEDDAEGEEQDLNDYLLKEESPERILTREINELTTVYREYKKISRFSNAEEINNLD